MLFTRCPECQTTFRISADTLRVASGAVRCGNCATIFSAYSGLRQDRLDEPAEGQEEFLSPPLQTQELAKTEDIESPELSDEDWEISVTEDDEAPAGEMIVLETLGDDFPIAEHERREPTLGDDEGEIVVLESAGDETTEDDAAPVTPTAASAASAPAPGTGARKTADAAKPRAADPTPAMPGATPASSSPLAPAVPPKPAAPPIAAAPSKPPATPEAPASPQPPAAQEPPAPPTAPEPPTVIGERPQVDAAPAPKTPQIATPTPAASEPATTETSDDHEPLEIESQVDEWAELLKAIEASVTEPERSPAAGPVGDASDAAEVSNASDDDTRHEPAYNAFDESDLGEILSIGEDDDSGEILAVGEPGESPDEAPAPWNVGEPALPPENAAPAAKSAAPPHPLTELTARSTQRPAAAARRDDEPGDESDDDSDDDSAISPEEIDATLSADPSPDILAALEAGLGELPDGEPISRYWSIASAALAIALCVQLIHHNRDALANQPVIGPVVATAYGLLGQPLFPAWDLRQYEITNR
jgi:predicted Zn finger-like uncharacterized protein